MEIKRSISHPEPSKGFHLASADVGATRRVVVFPGTERYRIDQITEAVPLPAMVAETDTIQAGYGVYTGDAELKDGPLRVWPVKRFTKLLAAGDLFA